MAVPIKPQGCADEPREFSQSRAEARSDPRRDRAHEDCEGQGHHGTELSISPEYVLDVVRRQGERPEARPGPHAPRRPHVTLKHYQQAIPAEVKAAAIALESELLEQQRKREAQLRVEVANVRLV